MMKSQNALMVIWFTAGFLASALAHPERFGWFDWVSDPMPIALAFSILRAAALSLLVAMALADFLYRASVRPATWGIRLALLAPAGPALLWTSGADELSAGYAAASVGAAAICLCYAHLPLRAIPPSGALHLFRAITWAWFAMLLAMIAIDGPGSRVTLELSFFVVATALEKIPQDA